MRHYAELRAMLASRRLPCAFVDLDAVDANLKQVLQRAGQRPVRVASKSVRCRWLLEYLLQASPQIQGLMCYTVAEAVWLAKLGFDNLLVAYPTQDREAVGELCALVEQGKRLTLMLDAAEQAQMLHQIAEASGVVLPICLDLDVSSDYPGLHFGVWRSPLRSLSAVQELVYQLKPLTHLRLTGVMGYEAQIAGVGDLAPGNVLQAVKNQVIRQLQRRSLPEVLARRQAVVDWLQQAGFELELVNGGGSGSLELTAQDRSVTELTAGSAFYAPTLFDAYSRFQLQPAAAYAMPIVRQPRPNTYTCLGGGYPASGSAGPDRLPSVWLPQGAQLTSLEGAGEVQTPVVYSGSERLSLGDPIFFRHAKAGELCERFNELHLLRGKIIQATVPTYRGEGKCFL